MDYIVVIAAAMTIVYSIFILRLYYRVRKKQPNHVEIVGQRKRIEDKLYILNELYLSNFDHLFDSNKLLLEFGDKDLSVSNAIPNYSFFENFGLDMKNIVVEKKTAFCIMPFNRKFDKLYSAIKDACSEANYKCFRSDEPFTTGNILRQILQMMTTSEVIIAVLDGKNPNVFYEIGLAHSIGKTVILVGNMQNPDDISFDLKSERLILYSSPKNLQQKLYSSLKQLHYV